MTEIPNLPIDEVSLNLSDDDLPCVSILMPCWRRRKFIPLMITNLVNMDYPRHKLELCILQDGDQDLFIDDTRKLMFQNAIGIKMKYVYEPNLRRTIGEKRNKLVKMASHKICAMMDSDDIYLPTYIRYSVNAIQQYKCGITSSASMMFVYPKNDFKMTGIKCAHKNQGHEACCVFTKKHFNAMGGFAKSSQGEGHKMISFNEKRMKNLCITKLMICVAHDGDEGNTIDKDMFLDCDFDAEFGESPFREVLKKVIL